MLYNVTKFNTRISYHIFGVSVLLLAFSTGCGNKFFDPTQVGRFRTVPAVNIILDSLGVAEETPVAWEEGEEPKPIDTIPDETDYTFRAGDIARIDIFELLGIGTRYVNDYPVSETGRISIPEVGVVEAIGLNEIQLEEKIKQILSPSILRNPLVTVTLMSSQQRAFSILGDGVLAPNRYVIPRYNFRLADAIAMASGTRQFNVSYIYVSRLIEDKKKIPPMSRHGFGDLDLKAIGHKSIPPRKKETSAQAKSSFQWPKSRVVISSSELITNQETSRDRKRFELFRNSKKNWNNQGNVWQLSNMSDTAPINEPISVQEVMKTLSERSGQQNGANAQLNLRDIPEPSQNPIPLNRQVNEQMNQERTFGSPAGSVTVGNTSESMNAESSGHIEWVFQNGKWVPVQVGQPKPTEPVIQRQPREQFVTPPEEAVIPDFGWAEQGAKTRLIKIPTEKLLVDSRYNIVIKPGDTIFVPVDIVGEFYIMGNVNRTGPIPITGRPMTLKQAIAAAGGLSPLAWPKRCEVIRRIGRKKEEIVMVDLDKIFNGEQPDFFIKPHDTINVGTHATARWRAILRNAFRATYGFGFVYDRNFADRDFYTRRPIPDWF